MERVFDEALGLGITSMHNSLASARAIRAYQMMKCRGTLRVRMGIIASGREAGLIEALIASGVQSGFGDDELRFIGVEWRPDCSTSGRTAAYYEPYAGPRVPGEPEDNRGMLLYEAEDLNAAFSRRTRRASSFASRGWGTAASISPSMPSRRHSRPIPCPTTACGSSTAAT